MTPIFAWILFFSLSSNPPGTIKVKNYYVDKTEIQNIHWMEYMFQKGKEDSTNMQKLLPHPANSGYSFAENRYKPIVLITYEQAIAYCAWRSKFVSGLLGKKIKYRLPTATEWKEIAEEVIKNDIKQIEIDLTETKKLIQKDSGQYVVIGIEKPKSRIYNLFDNVSEMTLDKGIAMGSNNYNLDDLKTNLTNVVYHYNATNSYLGFRCVAEKE